jgi:hypothetical protein
MPAANVAAQAGEGQINLFEIGSNYNQPVDVAGGILELSYYESILDHTVRATATFADTGYRKGSGGSAAVESGDINLTVGEKVNLKVTDGNQFTLDFSGDKQLRIKETRNIDESTNKIIFTVDLFSKESIDNELEQYRVKKRFDGKVSDSVEKILKEILKTPKTLDIDATLNKLSFIGNVDKPFYKCTWLGPRSVPNASNAKGNLAGFFFYETYDGFKFKSIDKLFESKPKKKYIFNNIIGEIPPGYDGKILDYSFDSTLDLKNVLLTGSQVNSKMKAVNAYESAYRENAFDSKNQFNTDNNGGKEQPVIAKDLAIQQQNSRISYKWDDPGFLVEGKSLNDQLPKSTYINYSNDEILRQSYMRYNNLFSIKLSIAIAGDMSLRAGDLIFCDFPEVSDKKNTLVSQKKGGVYMIADVCHRITKNGCYTRLNLIRESIGRKAAQM